MIRVGDIDPNFEQEVEFLNLSDLALSCPRVRAHMDGLNRAGLKLLNEGEVDKCNLRSPPTGTEFPNTCEEDPDCFRHFDKTRFRCALKSRRFDYAQEPVFLHKNENVIVEPQEYRQFHCDKKDSEDYNLHFLSSNGRQIPVTMYYRVIQSIRTGIFYVIFSSGVVLSGPDVVVNLRDFSLDIIKIVKGIDAPKICLCGHSMGATLSMVVAYHWFNTDRDFFESRVNVVALGPINLFEPGITFTRLPNIRSYLSATQEGENIYVDPFCTRGDASRKMYTPVKLILPYKEIDVDVTNIESDGTIEIVRAETTVHIDQTYANLHSLDTNYIPNLLSICKMKGGSRKRKRKKTKKMRSYKFRR